MYFDKEIDKAYSQVIIKKRFSNDIGQFFISLFDVEKSMYRLTVGVGTSFNTLKYLLNVFGSVC